MEKDKCAFTTTIAETLACAIDDGGDPFDINGFPLTKCPKFPCQKFKDIEKKCKQIDLEREQERKKNERY